MGYVLGVDLGTTYTSAAVARDGQVEVVPLGDRAPQVPSVVYRPPHGPMVFGEQAARHALVEPDRVAREFKNRIGDSTSLYLGGGVSVSAPELSHALLDWVVRRVSSGQGSAPDRVVVTHPATWGGYRLELMDQVVALEPPVDARLCAEPSAAAIHFALSGRMVDDRPVAVYDFGGGTFDASVVHRTKDGFDVVGTPEGLDHVGGLDLDDALFRLVLGSVEDVVDPDDPDSLRGLERLRKDCVEAKEALSDDTVATIAVAVGDVRQDVRVTREEFEELVGQVVLRTVETLRRVVRRAGLEPGDLGGVLLIGGSSRVPLVSEVLSREVGRPLLGTSQPKLCVAMGAALLGLPEPAVVTARAARRRSVPVVDPAPETEQPVTVPHTASTEVVATDEGTVVEVDAPVLLAAPEPSGEGRASHGRGSPGRARSTERRPRLRTVGLVLAAVALLLAVLGPREHLVLEATWDADHVVRPTTDLGSGSELRPHVLGVPLPGRVPRSDDGSYDLSGQRVFLAGAVRTRVLGPQPAEILLVPPPDSLTSRLLTLPGAAFAVLLLFGYAYAESLLRGIRRGRRRATGGEVVGLVATGAVLGLGVVTASWVLSGRFLVLGAAVVVAACCCAALGLLAFGWDGPDRRRTPSSGRSTVEG